jgi:hypothetical protein
MVGVTGLEPATSRPPAVRATNCATPRFPYRANYTLFQQIQPPKSGDKHHHTVCINHVAATPRITVHYNQKRIQKITMKTSSKRTKIKHLLNSVGYGVAICLPTVVGAGHASALTGGGTIGDPYTISTCTDLQDINTDPTAYYILVTDIDCSDTVTWNSGDGFTPIGGFSGTLDGQEHTVSGLSINNLASIGIFADVEDGTIKNLTIDGDGASITGDNGSGVLIGTMIGGTISHVTINEDIVAGSGWGGGIVGHAICNSPGSGILMAYTSYSGTLTQAGSLGYGGLVGYIEGNDPDCPITISNSHTSGTVSYPYGGDAGIYAGGLVGEAYTIASPITITASSSSMDVTNADSEIGGLVGFAFRDGSGFISIHGSSASGNITAKPTGHNTGGLVGEMYGDGEIYQSYAAGNVTAGSNVGGLVGIIGTDDISIHDVYATGAVSGDDSVGGLIGVLGSSGGTGATLARSYASGNVTGNTNVGGLVGGLYGAVSYSFATGAVDGTDAASTGGLFGYYNPSFFASSTGNAFDVASTGQTDCYGGGCDSGSMMSINTANYFVHTSTKPPLNHWDFTDVWQTTTDLPLLREEVLGGMTVGASHYPNGDSLDSTHRRPNSQRFRRTVQPQRHHLDRCHSAFQQYSERGSHRPTAGHHILLSYSFYERFWYE